MSKTLSKWVQFCNGMRALALAVLSWVIVYMLIVGIVQYHQLLDVVGPMMDALKQKQTDVEMRLVDLQESKTEWSKNVQKSVTDLIDGRTTALMQEQGLVDVAPDSGAALFLPREELLDTSKFQKIAGNLALAVPSAGDTYKVLPGPRCYAYTKPNFAEALPRPLNANEEVRVISEVQDFMQIAKAPK